MKRIFSIATILFLTLSVSSCLKMNGKMTVMKNCTGVYLEKNGNSYRVCNYDLLDGYEDNTKINVVVKKIENCSIDTPESPCMLVYTSKGKVEILDIK